MKHRTFADVLEILSTIVEFDFPSVLESSWPFIERVKAVGLIAAAYWSELYSLPKSLKCH